MDWEPAPAVPDDSVWREIPAFPNYYMSQYGQVFNLKRLHLIALCYNNHDILCVRMYQHSEMGSRGKIRSIPKLLRTIFPERANPNDNHEKYSRVRWPDGTFRPRH